MNMSVLILAIVCIALGAAFLWAFTGWQKTRAQHSKRPTRTALPMQKRQRRLPTPARSISMA